MSGQNEVERNPHTIYRRDGTNNVSEFHAYHTLPVRQISGLSSSDTEYVSQMIRSAYASGLRNAVIHTKTALENIANQVSP